MRTLGQKRAEYALKEVLKAKDIDKFDSFVAGAPAQILQNGFGQTLAFWLSKGAKKNKNSGDKEFNTKDKHIVLFDIIFNWLKYKENDINNEFIPQNIQRKDELIAYLNKISQEKYLTIQKEVLSLLEWVKRYAQAFCNNKDVNNVE
ncbi:MAG: putative cytosolic protein [Desulfonauticus sp. 38_4375]|nr:MAG: putative cytosolic protein [Desulfonauticus sp. 38_4375]